MPRVRFDALAQNDERWQELLLRLVRELPDLAPREFILLGSTADDARYIQFMRTRQDVLVGECSGSTVDGGVAMLSPEDQDRLLALGWGAPSQAPDDYPNYRVLWEPSEALRRRQRPYIPKPLRPAYLDRADARDAADLAMTTLRGPLGLTYAGEVAFERGSPDGSRRERRKRKRDSRWQRALEAVEVVDAFVTGYKQGVEQRESRAAFDRSRYDPSP